MNEYIIVNSNNNKICDQNVWELSPDDMVEAHKLLNQHWGSNFRFVFKFWDGPVVVGDIVPFWDWPVVVGDIAPSALERIKSRFKKDNEMLKKNKKTSNLIDQNSYLIYELNQERAIGEVSFDQIENAVLEYIEEHGLCEEDVNIAVFMRMDDIEVKISTKPTITVTRK